MNRVSRIFKMTILAGVIIFSGNANGQSLLVDGFAVMGLDGEFRIAEVNEAADVNLSTDHRWFFKAEKDFTDNIGTLKAGTEIEVLPGSSVERMTEEIEEKGRGYFRLWGSMTKFAGRNYLFIKYFLPIELTDKPTKVQGDDKVEGQVKKAERYFEPFKKNLTEPEEQQPKKIF